MLISWIFLVRLAVCQEGLDLISELELEEDIQSVRNQLQQVIKANYGLNETVNELLSRFTCDCFYKQFRLVFINPRCM